MRIRIVLDFVFGLRHDESTKQVRDLLVARTQFMYSEYTPNKNLSHEFGYQATRKKSNTKWTASYI